MQPHLKRAAGLRVLDRLAGLLSLPGMIFALALPAVVTNRHCHRWLLRGKMVRGHSGHVRCDQFVLTVLLSYAFIIVAI